jgi:hypothetical protein
MSAIPEPVSELGRLSAAEKALKPREADRYAEVHVNVGGKQSSLEVECYGRFVPSLPGSRETPPEAGGFIVDRVEYCGADITDLFTEEQMHALSRA